MNDLHAAKAIQYSFGIYLGDRELRDGAVRILPWTMFLDELAAGNIFPKATR
jgi:hypothetical protein